MGQQDIRIHTGLIHLEKIQENVMDLNKIQNFPKFGGI